MIAEDAREMRVVASLFESRCLIAERRATSGQLSLDNSHWEMGRASAYREAARELRQRIERPER